MPGIENLSDEDFLSLGAPAAIEQLAASQETTESTPTPEVDQAALDAAAQEEARIAEEQAAAAATTPDPEDGNVPPTDKAEGQVETPATAVPPVKDENADGDNNTDPTKGSSPAGEVVEGGDTTQTPPDYKAEFEKIMAPFTANGRKIELKSPDEVKQLMQMGANYTRKMQELAPHRRILGMLQNNKLTDESQLSFLIDLQKGDRAAIQKLLKDQGIDPREIDVDSDSTYQGGNHYVSDKQVNFQSVVDDIRSMDRGQETIAETLKWDQASIDAVGSEPAVLRTIHEQRVSGVYDLVSAEVNRRKVLGTIPADTPFLQAYMVVGNQMAEEETRAKAAAPVVVQPAQPAPIAKTTAAPKAVVKSGDKASAAATSRSTPSKAATPPINFAAMSDEDFMKDFGNFVGRV